MNTRLLPHAIALIALATSQSATAATQLVQDPGFEQGTAGSSPWTQFSSNFGSPLCTVAACGTGTGTGPRTGSWWAWFGGVTAPEIGAVSQWVTLPVGTAQLSFYFENIVSGDAADFIQARVDSIPVWTYNAGGAFSGLLGYTQINVDLSAFANGGAHTLEFYSVSGAAQRSSNFFVDDVTIMSSQVPEPESLALVALALAGLALTTRRKPS